ncbi:MAG: nicotinamide riboside transporter PnuC [Dysgonamonadaceae bacterium]|jgi:nicotinamide mononucleotide transporter|nr:nicotinamide riboside transporter PnuC [Dysgonamonadaceae bacterium]MDD3900013.1 nicotinamide riboside transporter PnuC [Dysgonamonadaceae bacterium]MDD4398763.1 nicotinamide riboside transporter PnuC [Dysgonamonadaceae bacterium]MEA5082096.1 nicotinamide riboside transporter PnuC [Dysgonamonadaceae bacterium]
MLFFQSIWFEIIGVIIGLLYIYYEYKASKWLWPIGVIMPIVYIIIYYYGKFYADMGIQFYYFFAGIYGWIKWSKGESSEDTLPISSTPKQYYFRMLLVTVALFIMIAFVLIKFTDSPVPYGDSLTTALSILAMWMLANKYIEQWWVWVIVDLISSGLYFWKGLTPTAILYAIYAIIAVFGYFKWRSIMLQEQKLSEIEN